MTYLLDADSVNYLLKSIPPVKARFIAVTEEEASFILSPVVHYQIVRYLMLKGATRIQHVYTRLVSGWLPVALELGDWDTAAELWAKRHRQGRPIEDGDLLIAVAALKTGATLVTNNTRHFAGLGLTLENWKSP